MKPRIIALCGRGNCGKSTTLLELIQRLLELGWILIDEQKHGNGIDKMVVLRNKNGKLIGVATPGDHYNEVLNALSFLSKHSCLLVFCACRTKDMPGKDGLYLGTHAALRTFSEEITFIGKTIVQVEKKELYLEANRTDIRRMMEFVE
ncbi:MAG: ATP-binding protein [Crocinitomicaceae bacterium]|jgi:hypothetical protein|nr:ATP-binding protein [Crocinitomicaceae bacterium]